MYLDDEILKALIERRDAICRWMLDNAASIAEQRQLDTNSPERLYWHYGYQAALSDLIEQLAAPGGRNGTSGILN